MKLNTIVIFAIISITVVTFSIGVRVGEYVFEDFKVKEIAIKK